MRKNVVPAFLGAVLVGVVSGAIGLQALSAVGLSGAAADRAANAILAGMDIAAALSLFGGVTSIAAFFIWAIRKALAKGSKRAIVA